MILFSLILSYTPIIYLHTTGAILLLALNTSVLYEDMSAEACASLDPLIQIERDVNFRFVTTSTSNSM